MAGNIRKLKMSETNEAYLKVLYWFFSFPNSESGLNDLASDLNIAKTTANRVITRLIKEGFLNKKIYGRAWRITCNHNHPYNFTRKVAYNLGLVLEAYSTDLRTEIFSKVGNVRSVILFGSYRKGDDTDESDLDIAVEVLDNEPVRILELGKYANFGFRKNVKINLNVFSRNKIDLNLFSNVANGFVLEGFLEVRP